MTTLQSQLERAVTLREQLEAALALSPNDFIVKIFGEAGDLSADEPAEIPLDVAADCANEARAELHEKMIAVCEAADGWFNEMPALGPDDSTRGMSETSRALEELCAALREDG